MSKFTYKTKDGSQSGFVPGVGAIVDGRIESPVKLESPNLVEVDGDASGAVEGTATKQNPDLPNGVQE